MDILLKLFLTSVVMFVACFVICRAGCCHESKLIDYTASVGVVSGASAVLSGFLWSIIWIWS